MSAVPLSDDARVAQRIGTVVANAWLLFLLFPVLTVLFDDLAQWRKIASCVVLALFALAHIAGYRRFIRREIGLEPAESGDTALRSSVVWFAVMVALVGIGLAVGGWAMFGAVPFLVSYALFQFSWSMATAVFGATLATVVVAPAVAGVLDDLWFFPVIVGSVGVGTMLIRLSQERQDERAVFQTRLALSDERQRVARDVHDVLGHSLTAVILKGQVIDRMLDRLPTADDGERQLLTSAREQLAELDAVSRRALAEIRSTVGGLRSADLADELMAARAVLADAGVALTVAGDASGVANGMRPVLGWVVREAVTNVVRHADADHCTIAVGDAAGQAVLRIADDGVGVSSVEGNGLSGLRERLASADAELRIGPGEAGGTVIEVLA